MSTLNTSNLTINADNELLMILKNDLISQSVKIKNKLINMTTLKFDQELINIIKEDISFLKSQLSNPQHLAKAS
ncbi:MAG: hypothetical protein ABIP95_15565 [Pelobium sp.]